MRKIRTHERCSVCQSDVLNNAKCKPNALGPQPQVVKQLSFQIYLIKKSPIKWAFSYLLRLWTLTFRLWTQTVARYVLYTSAASLVTGSRPRRHHYSERGLPLCLNTFRAFLQLSFLLKARPAKVGLSSVLSPYLFIS